MRLWQSLLLLLGAGAGYVRHGHGVLLEARALGLLVRLSGVRVSSVWRQREAACDLSVAWRRVT